MNATWNARIELDFGGERRAFRLGMRELIAVQDRCGAGPQAVWERLRGGTWTFDDLRETIRFGLEGAGVEAREAGKLVDLYVVPPLMSLVPVAASILTAALLLPAELDDAGKAPGDGA